MKGFVKNLLRTAATVALASAVAFSGFAAFNSADAANQPRPGFDPKKIGGKVTYASFADAQNLLPYASNDAVSSNIRGFIYDGLLSQDDKLNPIPNVAYKWDVSPDGMTYTFYMRKDVKFHDGKPMTADDVVFSFQVYMNPNTINAYKYAFEDLEKVEKVDDYTVRMKLNKKNVLFMYSSPPYAAIMPKHKFPNGIEDYNKNVKLHRAPIGSGPFKFKEWKTAERIVLEANKDYFQGRPYLDQIIMRILPDANVEVLNLLKGSVDFVETIQPKQVAEVTKNKNLKVIKHDTARYDYIGWNMDLPIFSDVKVRQALAYGLNRQALVDKIMLGNATLAVSNFHPSEVFHNKSLKPYPYDVKKANELLDAAGWKMGKDGIREKDGKKFEIEIAYNNGNKIREAIAAAAQQDWKKIGVKATPRSYDFTIQSEKIQAGEIEMWIGAWSLGTNPDKTGLFHSSTAPVVKDGKVVSKGNNTSRVRDKKVDEILDKFKLEPDANKRIAMYQELGKIMYDNQYNLFLYHPAAFTGMNKKLSGVKISMYDVFYNVIDWYWEK